MHRYISNLPPVSTLIASKNISTNSVRSIPDSTVDMTAACSAEWTTPNGIDAFPEKIFSVFADIPLQPSKIRSFPIFLQMHRFIKSFPQSFVADWWYRQIVFVIFASFGCCGYPFFLAGPGPGAKSCSVTFGPDRDAARLPFAALIRRETPWRVLSFHRHFLKQNLIFWTICRLHDK